MDCRITLGESESFREMLLDCMNKKQRAEMIFDHNGLDRAGGIIESIYDENGHEFIRLENGEKIKMAEIVAVNGVFASAYAGC